MNKHSYPRYGAVLLVGAAIAVWAGLPPVTLVFLLVCPLMMFFMMRGMHGGDDVSETPSRTPVESRDEAAEHVGHR